MNYNRATRYIIESPLHAVDPISGAIIGDIKNISHIGLMMITSLCQPKNTKTRLRIGQDPAVNFTATTMWTTPHPSMPGQFIAGYSFVLDTIEAEKDIKTIIQRQGRVHRVQTAIAS